MPKGHGTHNAPLFFSNGGLGPSSQGKILCFRTLSMENCRPVMRICPNAFVACDVPMMQMRLLKFHLYIYGGEPSKSMKFPMDSSFVTQSFFPLLLFPPSPMSIGRRKWRSYGGRLLEASSAVRRQWILCA